LVFGGWMRSKDGDDGEPHMFGVVGGRPNPNGKPMST
jgi:hypothetical protein